MSETLVSVKNISKTFAANKGMFSKKKFVHAVNDVSFDIKTGETFSLVGESGCGKSTTGKLIDHLITPDSGEIWFEGKEISKISQNEMRPLRSDIQMVFQDPYGSLNPRMKVQDLIGEPLLIHTNMTAGERLKKVHELLQVVGLSPSHGERYPHEFSGGQRQRIGIARALAVEPEFIVCDEPISALDVSIQSQIINLLKDLQKTHGFTYMFIAHDLNIVKYISDRIAVMYLGNLVELADSDEIYAHTLHPYSQALLASVPIPDPDKEAQKEASVLSGDVPSPINPKPGCPFANRCKYATEKCHTESPKLREARPGHFVSCHLDME